MTSGESFENKWFYMKYKGKYLGVEILLTRECISIYLTSLLFAFIINFLVFIFENPNKCKNNKSGIQSYM